jgi:hypothetical protein
VASRIHLVQERFGCALGDRVLSQFARHLTEHLGEGRIFRWTATSFLSVHGPRQAVPDLALEAARLTAAEWRLTVTAGERLLLFPILCSARVFPLKSAPAAGRGARQKRNSAELAAGCESVVGEILKKGSPASDFARRIDRFVSTRVEI